jgi:anaerobic selenocysteine-containing dehydrogenase
MTVEAKIGFCTLCRSRCGSVNHVENGRLVNVTGDPEHPMTRGGLCVKLNNYADHHYNPDRLLHPLKRSGPKGSGQFQQITYDDALAEIKRRWTDIIIFYPGAFTHYSYALRDAIAAVNKPLFEVHLSDPTQREEWRRKCVFEDLPDVQRFMGMGVNSYMAALDAAFTRA